MKSDKLTIRDHVMRMDATLDNIAKRLDTACQKMDDHLTGTCRVAKKIDSHEEAHKWYVGFLVALASVVATVINMLWVKK